MSELPEPWPDDMGAHCPEVPDGLSMLDAAVELARSQPGSLTAAEWFCALVAGYWQGALAGVYTPEQLPTPRPADGDELPKAIWEEPDTLTRRAVYWRPEEYAAYLARFWYVGDEPPATRLPDLGTDAERMRWLAALPLADYPPTVRQMLGRLHISRASLQRWLRGAESPRRRGGKQHAYWPAVEAEMMRWLEDEGEPDRLAEAERALTDIIERRGLEAAESTIRAHTRRCLERYRERYRGQ
jgi:hypothetical protein